MVFEGHLQQETLPGLSRSGSILGCCSWWRVFVFIFIFQNEIRSKASSYGRKDYHNCDKCDNPKNVASNATYCRSASLSVFVRWRRQWSDFCRQYIWLDSRMVVYGFGIHMVDVIVSLLTWVEYFRAVGT